MLNTTINRFKAMLNDESGLSAVEYGLLAAGIAVAVFGVIKTMGTDLADIYTSVTNDLTGQGT